MEETPKIKSKYYEYRLKPYWRKIYNSYRAMISRCYSKNNEKYPIYGARGIVVCDEWRKRTYGRINFYNWAIANGYQYGLTIDRIDVDGNYEPNNCRWVDDYTQANNKTNNFMIEFNGVLYPIHILSRKFDIPVGTLRYRVKSGWDIEKALTTKPIVGRNQFSI